MKIAQPIIQKIKDDANSLADLERSLSSNSRNNEKIIIADFPTVYIHNWGDTEEYEVYIGESNNVFKRTRQHYETGASDDSSWQSELRKRESFLYIIGHEHFNKSMTLDIENRLMQYMISAPRVRKVHNMRGNPQTSYYPLEELDGIFTKIWTGLRKDNKDLFPKESEIRDSAIFKASPLHKLTEDQINARELIINRIIKAIETGESGQIIFVEGEAGTGKTVLNSSTFYELYCQAEEGKVKNLDCHLLVNHDEQLKVYQQIAEKLGLLEKYGEVVSKPTSFINKHSKDNPVDVSFVDEAHLLWTQGKQSYTGDNQLSDIIDRAKVTVVMFDENQILSTEQYWEAMILDKYRNIAKESNNYIVLKDQLRMHATEDAINWIDNFTKERKIQPIPGNNGDYAIRVFDSPEKLDAAICEKAKEADFTLSRLVATYDWRYSSNKRPEGGARKYWEVAIGKWHKPWNRELNICLNVSEKHQNSKLAWAEQPQTINEVGSTFTIQGFDLNYAGVILGPSVKYRDGNIVFDPTASCNEKAVRNRTLSNGTKQKFGEELLQHEVRVLMTRGVNGLYIYACDDELRKELLSAVEQEDVDEPRNS